MMSLNKILGVIAIAGLFAACKKDVDPIIVIKASDGSQMQLNGLIASESGSSAGNSVFVDLSAAQQTTSARASWDLGFYCGSDFRVIINNTTSATARMLSKNDLNAVSAADTIPSSAWTIGFDVASFALVDNVHGDLTKTVIAPVSINDADNKVYVINRGTGGGIAAKPWWKVRILHTANGYILQYARITETTFRTIAIPKDEDYNFKFVSFGDAAGTTGASIAPVEPVKNQWDFKWSYTMFETAFGTDMIPFASSDFIVINSANGVQAAEVLNTTVSYDLFSANDFGKVTFSSSMETIGAKWRTASPTPGASGVKIDRFYLIKDPAGNKYKLKFLSFHGDEGGTRGKPIFQYKLVQ